MDSIKNGQNLKKTTYRKVVNVLIYVSIGFVVLFCILFYFSYLEYKQVSKIATEQFENESNALVELNSNGYLSLIGEITFWDELVDFVEKKDIVWFDNSLSYLVDTNKIDYMDAYNLDGDFVSKVSTNKIKSSRFIPKQVFKKLHKDKIIHFYTKIPEGVVEVFGATIHPSEDPFKNKTSPKGYLFMVKLFDKNYFHNLEKVMGSEIDFSSKKYKSNDKKIFFNKIIRDYQGNEISSLRFSRINTTNFSQSKNLLFVLLFAVTASILIFLSYAKKLSRSPIKLIKDVLENENKDSIIALKKIPGEFSYIGKLFEENISQRQELKTAKTKAEESDKLKSAFLLNISHEIRTPMNAIVGFSELLLNPEITSFDRNEYINFIQTSGKNLVEIIDDLVEMSLIDSELIKPNLVNCDLDKLVSSVYNTVANSNKLNKEIDVKIIKPKSNTNFAINTDAVKLNQILINLMNNALKFTSNGFVILSYEIDLKNSKILFSIKDSGIGIADELKDKIFNRFIKIDKNKSEVYDGLGLGLSIAKSYINLLGGEIALKSELGVGSTFSFDIPLKISSDLISDNSITILDYQLGNEEIVLVAEDDQLNFILIEKLLSNCKLKVIHAKDGAEAVEYCKTVPEIDLVLMDIKMPNLDGYEAFLEIRSFNKSIPIIAQTAYTILEEIEKIKKIGFNDVIYKPLNKQSIHSILEKYLKK